MGVISENIKFFRKQLGLTQEQLAQKIGIKRSLLGAYEEGRAEPGLETLTLLARLFGSTVDLLISESLSDPEKRKEAMTKDVEGKRLRVLAITVDKDDKENIQLVPQKAAAGYLNGYSDPEYVAELPKFYLPIFSGSGTYRAFEIKGDSMLPLPSGSLIIGQYLDNWNSVKDQQTYVLVTVSEGIVYKRIHNNIKKNETLRLISDNPAYEPYDINVEDVLEIWESKAYISTDFPKPDMSVEKLSAIVSGLQKQVSKLSNE
ncbi:MAG: XRE family transcriptional regulator [Cytophaga sp.]|uniref:XRE family transcriptional regulator n=1 Tax=Cytophaga sp. TaxID=29535 RepID=UPI003F7EECFD